MSVKDEVAVGETTKTDEQMEQSEGPAEHLGRFDVLPSRVLEVTVPRFPSQQPLGFRTLGRETCFL